MSVGAGQEQCRSRAGAGQKQGRSWEELGAWKSHGMGMALGQGRIRAVLGAGAGQELETLYYYNSMKRYWKLLDFIILLFYLFITAYLM